VTATIKAKEFILRPIEMKDAKLYFESQQDDEAKKGFMSTPGTLSEAKEEIKHKLQAMKDKTGETLAIEINGEYAGYVELHDITKNPYHKHKAIIGYCMHPKHRGKGITTKAVKLVTAYAFEKYNLKRISGWCRTFNKASARVLEKAGYKLEGIMRKNKFKDGKYLDDMIWAKVK
jgi:[ribosomal protein S5]-alanine N-acetyltransferase